MSDNKIIDGLNDALAFLTGDSERGRLETRVTRFGRLSSGDKASFPPSFSAPLKPRLVKVKPEQGDGR